MSYIGSKVLNNNLTFYVQVKDPVTKLPVAADAAPTYRVYEEETATPILTGTMATLDAGNTTGYYSEQITLSAANGFEIGKDYSVRIAWAVSSADDAEEYHWQMGLEASSISANAITATAIQDGAITAAKIATGAIDADSLAADAIAAINATVDTALSDYDGPTNAELATALAGADDATLAAIAALNNFDPATDTVILANGAHGGTSATLRLGGSSSTPALYVTNSGGDAVQFESTGGNGHGFDVAGNGTGRGVRSVGGATGHGIESIGGATSGSGAVLKPSSSVSPIYSADQGDGLWLGLGSAGGTGLSANAATINDFTVTTNNIVWNAAWAAPINAEVDQALADYDGPTNAEMVARTLAAASYATAANQTTILSNQATLATAVADVPTVAEFEARTIVSASYSTLTAAQVNAEVDTALADYDGPTNAEMEARTLVAAAYATAANQSTIATAIADVPTVAEFEARTLVAASYGTAANQATIAGFLDTEIAEIITDLGTITTHLTDIKGGTFNGATDSLEEISDAVAGISSGTGSGARTITITVDDGTDPLESARVRLTKGAESYVGSTDVDGELVFNVDDGTWVVAINLPGYTFAGASLVVNGDETQTYSLTALSITPPSDPLLCTGYMITVDKEGLVVAGIDITVKLVDGPGTAGYAYERNLWVETSDVNGYVEFVGLVRGARYRIRRETSEWVEFVVPDADTVALAEVVG